ncbi:unnamed protein product [Mucor hiemalis]
MKRLSTASTTAAAHHQHSHHHHSHSISSTTTIRSSSGTNKLLPLHRSITDEKSYSNNNKISSSPITKFVCKLLGLAGPSTSRPRIWHKSGSTTSITKSSVISSYQTQKSFTSESSTKSHSSVRKPTAITIVTPPQSPCTLSSNVMDWDRGSLPNSNLYLNQLVDDDSSSIVSSSNSTNSLATTVDSSNSVNNSAAVDALVIASLIPTKAKPINFDEMPIVTLSDRKQDSEVVLTEDIAELIRPYLPRRYRVAPKWNLLYSLDQHGVSLGTMYSQMKDYEGPCMMIIKDADEQIFGSYLSNTLSSQSHYYGTGECFLWKLSSHLQKDVPKVKTYPWTGKNDYMILSDTDFIAIGGGNGKFGLWLNSNLEKGYSDTCPTFDNESLSPKPEFNCIEMEIWGFCM